MQIYERCLSFSTELYISFLTRLFPGAKGFFIRHFRTGKSVVAFSGLLLCSCSLRMRGRRIIVCLIRVDIAFEWNA